jgi:hypothetical protein
LRLGTGKDAETAEGAGEVEDGQDHSGVAVMADHQRPDRQDPRLIRSAGGAALVLASISALGNAARP